MNKRLIIISGIFFIILISFAAFTFLKDNNITSYVSLENVSEENITKTVIKEDSKITGEIVKEIKPSIVTISFTNKKEYNLGYLPKTLILEDLISGATIKLGKIELMIGGFRGSSVILAIIGENTNNVYLTEQIKGNYNTLDGEIDILYENDKIIINRLTNPNNYD